MCYDDGVPTKDRKLSTRGDAPQFGADKIASDVAALAQLAEHALRKRKVMGSIPIGGFSWRSSTFGGQVRKRANSEEFAPPTQCAATSIPEVGLEPTISSLGGRRLIH